MYVKEVEIFPKKWVSVGQLTSKLQAVKVEGLTKNSAPGPSRTTRVLPGFNFQTIGSISIQRSSRILDIGFAHSK